MTSSWTNSRSQSAAVLDRVDLDRIRADADAAVDWNFAGVATWLVSFELESLRDAATVQGHWTRLASALTVQIR